MAALDWISKKYPKFRIPIPGTKSGVSIQTAKKVDDAFASGVQTAMKWAVNQWRGRSNASKVQKMPIGRKRARPSEVDWPGYKGRGKSKRQRTSTIRRGRYQTFGRSGPQFQRGRKTKLNKFVKSGAICKIEDGGTLEGIECIYIGHYSLPIIFVWRSAMMALARRILKAMNIEVQDPQQDIGYGKALTMQINYRDSLFGPAKTGTAHAIASLGTLMDLQDDCATAIVTDWAATDTYYEVIDFFVYDAAGEVAFKCSGANMFFEIVGNSHLQIQNRTLANDNVGDEHARNALDITNNPLRGKRYDGYGNIHPLKFNNIFTAGTIPQFSYSTDYGVLAIDPETATNYSTEVKASLHKPPLKTAFGGVNKQTYVMISPGEIRRSSVKGILRGNLNQLLNRYTDAFRGQTNFNTPSECYIRKGSASFYGFEKLCDVRDTTVESANIAVGYELNSTISAICYIKKMTAMNALQTITTS